MTDDPNPAIVPPEVTPAPITPPPVPPEGNPPKPETASDFYYMRQAEKAQKERDAIQAERDALKSKADELERAQLSEAEKAKLEAEEAKAEAATLRKSVARMQAIQEAGLPQELAALVPEGTDDPKAFIEEKILPLKDKFADTSGGFGGPTRPVTTEPPDEDAITYQKFQSLIQQYGAEHSITQRFYNTNADAILRGVNKAG